MRVLLPGEPVQVIKGESVKKKPRGLRGSFFSDPPASDQPQKDGYHCYNQKHVDDAANIEYKCTE